jgi:hypothetical protein
MRGIIILIIAVFSIPAAFADIIYDEQTYNYDDTINALSIYGPLGYETADDFETNEDWTLELVKVWFITWGGAHDTSIRVDIFEDTGGGPGTTLYREVILSDQIGWILVSDWYAIYEADIPITGFDIVTGTRYWLGLQTAEGDSQVYWLVMLNKPDWWSNCYFYDGSTWYDSEDYYGQNSACEFELHGTPAGSGVNARSLGAIKALYR